MSDENISGAAGGAASGAATGAMVGGPWGAVAGALIGGGLSFMGQSSANAANREIAQMQMAFQERMANTQYQRAVADLKAAGLNPMMAYGNIHTASPSGSAGIAQQNVMGQASEQVGSAVGKGVDAAVKMASVENLFKQNQQIQATTAKTEAETVAAYKQADLYESQAAKNDVDMLQGLAMTDYYKQLQAVPSAQAAHYRADIPYLHERGKGEGYMNWERAASARMYGSEGRSGGDVIPYVKQVLPAVSSAVGGAALGGLIKWGRKPQVPTTVNVHKHYGGSN